MLNLNLGNFKGVPIHLNVSVVLGFAFVAWIAMNAAWFAAATPLVSTFYVVLVTTATYLSVLWHEIGHTKKALQLGYHVEKIYIMAIGGGALMNLSNIYSKPKNEVKISIAGPLHSFSLFLIFLGCAFITVNSFPVLSHSLLFLAMINFIMSFGNMIPVYPLDGGRVLRGLLSSKFGLERGMRYSYFVGMVLASCLVGLGVFIGDFVLILISVWLFFDLQSEQKHIQKFYA